MQLSFAGSGATLARRIALVWAALILLAAGVLAPEANAQSRNLVIFGDSVIADTPGPEYLTNRVGSLSSGSSGSSGSSESSAQKCPTSNSNFGIRAAHKLGLPAWDYSCAGATSISPGPQFSGQVDRALASGALTPSTARVIVSTGFNDTYNNNNQPGGVVRGRFVDAMAPQIQRIRAAAPNARIQIVGYSTITDRGHVCLVHLGANIHDRTPFPQVAHWERLAQDMQIDLARATGVEFLDMKAPTAGNSMCAPDGHRTWAGLIDFHAGPGNLPVHMTYQGHERVAEVIAAS